jgi:arylsulfatase A-like enzyme
MYKLTGSLIGIAQKGVSMSIQNRLMALLLAVSLLLALSACGAGNSDSATPIRLVDNFRAEMVKGTPDSIGEITSLAYWAFSKPPQPGVREAPATLGWRAGPNVAGLALRNGRLTGRSTGDFPIIYVTQTSENDDLVHSIEIRMRAAQGANLSIGSPLLRRGPDTGAEPDFNQIIPMARQMPWLDTTPLLPGEGFQTYTIQLARPTSAKSFRQVLIRPTDVPNADFEIESVRIVSRREHLARIPSGIGWQGLSEIYHETLVARSPESIEVDLDLAQDPWLDLSVGTVEFAPVTFRVSVRPTGDSKSEALLERTITMPHRWESVPIDLSRYQGSKISLLLSLESSEPGTLGFWGSPVVRYRGSRPAVAQNARAGDQAKVPQGVILIMADTLRRDHLNFYGYGRETAPFLTRLAEEGALFKDTIAQATWTKVSAPAIMTSLYPTAHGVKEFTDTLPAAANTMAEVFRSAGYATVSYSSVLFTGKFTNLHQGFEELHESTSVTDRESSKTAREYVDRLTQWLEVHKDVPFFVFLHVFDPHDPYEPYPPYNGIWADLSKKEEHLEHLKKVREVIKDPLMKNFGMPNRQELIQAGLNPDEYVGYDKDWYDGSIRALDSEIARLHERLRMLGLSDKTLLVFTSDHGEEFLEHGKMFHGQSTYAELSQVPLFFHLPGVVPSNVVIEQTVETIDIMPTVLELAGLREPGELMGRSLVPQIAGRKETSPATSNRAGVAHANESLEPRPAITEKAPTKHIGGPPPRDKGAVAVIWQGWKLIHNFERAEGAPEFELFNRAEDPLDQHNVAEANPEQVRLMHRMIDAWRQRAEAGRLPESDSSENLSKEELQRLRGLGYIK